MERDHDKPRADPEPARRSLEKSIESVELAVHPDADGLERPRGRIDSLVTAAGDRATNYRRKLQRGLDRRFLARTDDRPSDTSRKTLLAVGVNRVGQFALAGARDELCRGIAPAAIHAHVERLVALKTESAAWCVELHRGDAEVGERAVHQAHTARVEHFIERAVVGMNEIDPIGPGCERDACSRKGILISIQTDDPRGARFEERPRMATEPDSTIDEEAASFGPQVTEYVGGED